MISTASPIIEVRGNDYGRSYVDFWEEVKEDRGFFVHEHLLRERSSMVEKMIDKQKKKGKEKVVITIHAKSRCVSSWIDWLYGQPMFPFWAHDDILPAFVEVFRLARQNEDYECANLCLDGIRTLFLEELGLLYKPLDKLEPLLDALKYDEYDVVLDMIVHMVVYRPDANPRQTMEWLTDLAEHCDLEKWTNKLWQQLGLAFATKAAAQDSAHPEYIPDITDEHAYHLRQPGGLFCCGRNINKKRPAKKRKAVEEPTEQEDEDEE